MTRGCSLGDGRGCLTLAFAALKANQPDASDTLHHALSVAGAACTLADGRACESLADVLAGDVVSAANATRMIELLDRACDHDQLLTCVQLATALERGPVERRDQARITSLRARACKRVYPFSTSPGQ